VGGRRARGGLLAVAVALTVAHCWLFRDFTVDDAAISFTYARSFAEGHGLILLPGAERVEGYSNFLWVMLLSAGHFFGGDIFVVAKWLGALFAALTVVGTAELVAALRQTLPLYMVPSTVDLRDELPRSPNGKFDRTLLKAQVSAGAQESAQAEVAR